MIKSVEGERHNEASLESYVNMKWEREALSELDHILIESAVLCAAGNVMAYV